MKKLHYIILLFFPVAMLAQDGWVEQNSGISENINSLYFFSSSTGFAAGNNGKLIQTTDGGTTWSVNSIVSTSNFQKIFFRNSTDGYLLSQDGKLYTTTDTGVSWTEETLDIHGLNSIAFNGNNGVIVGDDGKVFTSIDGSNWTKQSVSLGVFTVNDVLFFDDTTVIAVGAGGWLYRSINKGITWLPAINSGTNETLSAIEKMNDSTMLIAGNGGKVIEYEPTSGSLKFVAVGLTSIALKDISCSQDDVCHVVGNESTVLIKTFDNWLVRKLDDNVNLNTVQFLNHQTGYVGGITGVIYRHDGGGFQNSIAEIKKNDVSIFPNPVSNILHIAHPIMENMSINIFDSFGKLVTTIYGTGDNSIVNTGDLPSGIYVLQIAGSQSRINKKLIKK
ncbi:MAG: photosystem II stability/assembly factor-like uncharacterized protein [Saprospiraceae bacterium]|jgi:photosystem II stability/assembly factor-like uncharacterized protein